MSEPDTPPFVPPVGISTSSGTWDDWLAMRPQPQPEPGQNGVSLSDADYVAAIIATGHLELVDFSMEIARNGMRDLFAEFEASTKGQTVLWRKPEVQSPKVELTVVRTDENRLRVAIAPDSGRPLGIDLDLEQAVTFMELATSAIKDIAEGRS